MTSAISTEDLIKEIYARPAMWQLRHPQHRYKKYIQKLWMEIMEKYPGISLTQLKKKWKNLKDTYRKELKKIPKEYRDQNDPDCQYHSQWVHFWPMNFIRNESKPIEDEAPGAEDVNNDDQSSKSSSDNEMPESEIPNSPPQSPHPIRPSRQDSSSRKSKLRQEFQTEHIEIEKKKLKILEQELNKQNPDTHSDNYHFLMSILPEMDKLPPMQKLRLRNNINQALMNEMSLAMYEDPLQAENAQLCNMVSQSEDRKTSHYT